MAAAEEAMIGFLHKKTTGHIQRWKRRYCELAAGGRFIKIFHEEHSRRSQQQQQQPPHAETAGLKGVVDVHASPHPSITLSLSTYMLDDCLSTRTFSPGKYSDIRPNYSRVTGSHDASTHRSMLSNSL